MHAGSQQRVSQVRGARVLHTRVCVSLRGGCCVACIGVVAVHVTFFLSCAVQCQLPFQEGNMPRELCVTHRLVLE
jgi:hypothetical protein